MNIIKDELKKIYHFLLLLLLLYAVNLGFNMLYDWGGVSVIVRVYIMVLSCYIVYNFSQLDGEGLRDSYRKEYGRIGSFYLFMVLRIFPFLFIYIMTVIFTLINYVQSHGWPVETILRLMDGRYSNTVIYALILFIVLRLKIRPGISIPVFIAVAVFYFYTDKFLYRIFDPGAGISLIKLMKFVIFYFILLYGFSKKRLRLFYSVFISSLAGIATFLTLIAVFFLFFLFSEPGGKIHSNSAEALLKYGFYGVFSSYERSIDENNNVQSVPNLIRFSENGRREIFFKTEKWEYFIEKSAITDSEKIFRYLYRKRIMLNFTVLSDYAVRQSSDSPVDMYESIFFKKYYALYYSENRDRFFSAYNEGDLPLRRWIIDVLGYVNDYDSIHFLVNILTDPEKEISERAYESLKKVTQLDPAGSGKTEIHDLDVVEIFRDYAENLKKM